MDLENYDHIQYIYAWSNLYQLATQWYIEMIPMIDHSYMQVLNNFYMVKHTTIVCRLYEAFMSWISRNYRQLPLWVVHAYPPGLWDLKKNHLWLVLRARYYTLLKTCSPFVSDLKHWFTICFSKKYWIYFNVGVLTPGEETFLFQLLVLLNFHHQYYEGNFATPRC